MREQRPFARVFSHVLWIGGAPCAGKTTIADALAAKYRGVAYHFDRMEPDHIARSNETSNPELMAFLALDMDQRWLLRTPEEMARNTIASWRARFPLALEDLRALPADAPIFAEGPGLFPDCVALLLSSPEQGIWLVPMEPFCLAIRTRRAGVFEETSDPPRALRNLVKRDMLMARFVKREAAARQYACHEVDGSRTLDQMIALVERHFAPYLGGKPR